MSFAPTYLQPRKPTRSPVSLTAALAINGAVLGALLFASPAVREKLPTVIGTIHIPLVEPEPLPPPPKPPENRTSEQPTPRSVPTPSTPVIEPRSSDFTTTFPPPLPPLTETGEIGGGAIVDPPKPSVFVGPQIDQRYVHELQPPYPPGKIRAEEEGVVIVRVLIGPDGRVKRIEKVEGDDDFFRATAAQATRRWRFKPATRDGVAVEGWRTMTVRFELDS